MAGRTKHFSINFINNIILVVNVFGEYEHYTKWEMIGFSAAQARKFLVYASVLSGIRLDLARRRHENVRFTLPY